MQSVTQDAPNVHEVRSASFHYNALDHPDQANQPAKVSAKKKQNQRGWRR